MSTFAEEMAEYEGAYSQAEASASPNIFTDGKHQAVIVLSRIERSERFDQWQWVLRFQGVDSKTRQPASIQKWTNLPPDTDDRHRFLKSDRKRLEDPDWDSSLASLERACEDERFIGLVVDIGVKTKPGNERDYTNVYINSVVQRVNDVNEWLRRRGVGDTGGSTDDYTESYQHADDDIPFAPTMMTSGPWGV
jgi:hypothetical protein